eukprot:scaffold26571_cov53-Prasinocladus_malaysianus.AAC.1
MAGDVAKIVSPAVVTAPDVRKVSRAPGQEHLPMPEALPNTPVRQPELCLADIGGAVAVVVAAANAVLWSLCCHHCADNGSDGAAAVGPIHNGDSASDCAL